MLPRTLSALLLFALVPVGCQKDDEDAKSINAKEKKADGGDAAEEGGDAADAKAEGGDGDAKAEGGGAKAAEGGELPNAAGGAVVDADAVVDCPESLKGREKVDRVITKECGVVPVTGDYSIEGATLTLQPGATLAFAEGAKLSVGYYEPAKLIVNGTAEAPVTLTTSADKVAGVWQGVHLFGKANRSSIEGVVVEYAGSKRGAIVVEAQDVSISGSTIRHAKGEAVEVAREGTVTIVGTTTESVGPVAMRVTPSAAGGIAAGNTFPAGALVQIENGKVVADTTWADIGVPWLLTGPVQVNGEEGRRATLTVAAGAKLVFDGDGSLDLGYYQQARLLAEGQAGKPVVFAAHERQEPGGWNGLKIFGKGEATFAHAQFVHGGKDENAGVLSLQGEAHVTLKDTTFENNAVGVVVRGKKVDLKELDRVTFTGTPVAFKGAGRYLGVLGSGNRYVGEPAIVVESDKIETDMEWKRQEGATVQLDGTVQVSGGRLTVAAGSTFNMKDGVELQVGYYDTAGVELKGTADAPISFVGQRDEPGTWGGLVFYGKAKGNVLENVVVRNAGGQAGVRFDGESDAKITGLRCDNCSTPALKWSCKGKIEHAEVAAGEGTPSALEAPKCG